MIAGSDVPLYIVQVLEAQTWEPETLTQPRGRRRWRLTAFVATEAAMVAGPGGNDGRPRWASGTVGVAVAVHVAGRDHPLVGEGWGLMSPS